MVLFWQDKKYKTVQKRVRRGEKMKRVTILTGAFGSGKTECAVALARAIGRKGDDVALVDMDIVNAFFRSAFQEEKLTADNVTLIATGTAMDRADMPVVTPEVMSIFTKKDRIAVIDMGGDDTGARALGQFKTDDRLGGQDNGDDRKDREKFEAEGYRAREQQQSFGQNDARRT